MQGGAGSGHGTGPHFFLATAAVIAGEPAVLRGRSSDGLLGAEPADVYAHDRDDGEGGGRRLMPAATEVPSSRTSPGASGSGDDLWCRKLLDHWSSSYTMSNALRGGDDDRRRDDGECGEKEERETMIHGTPCHSLAPSTRAASRSSGLMPFRAAEMMTMQKPVHNPAHDPNDSIVLKLRASDDRQPGENSHPRGAQRRVERPVCGLPGGSRT